MCGHTLTPLSPSAQTLLQLESLKDGEQGGTAQDETRQDGKAHNGTFSRLRSET